MASKNGSRPARPRRPGATPPDPRLLAREQRARLAIWLMVAAPLVWLPGGFSRFVVAKCLVVAVALVVAATVPSRARLPRAVALGLGAGALLFTLAALVGDTPLASLLGRWPRYEGLPVLGLYAACVWAGARLLDSARRVDVLVTASAAASCVLAAFSLLDVLGWSPLGPTGLERTGSLLGNATDQGLVALMALAVLARPAWEQRRDLLLAGTAAAALTVVLSGSRAALLGAVVVLLVLAARERAALLRPALIGIGLLVVTALAVAPTRERLLEAQTVRGRWLEWGMAARIVGDHPWTGIGPSRFVDEVGRYEDAAWVEWAGTRTALDSPHDWLLQVLLAGGLPLLACALAVVVIGVRLALVTVRERPELVGVLLAVAGYGAAMTINFTNPTSTCLAAFLAGALVGRTVPAGSPGEGGPSDAAARRRADVVRAGVGGLAALGVVALLVVSVSEVMLRSGLQRADQGRPADAERLLSRAVALRPGDPDARMIAAQGLAALGSETRNRGAAGDAERFARASLERTPQTLESRVALAVSLLVRERPAEALVVLDAAARDYPWRPKVFTQRGLARAALDDLAGARADLRRARDLGDPVARRILRDLDRAAR